MWCDFVGFHHQWMWPWWFKKTNLRSIVLNTMAVECYRRRLRSLLLSCPFSVTSCSRALFMPVLCWLARSRSPSNISPSVTDVTYFAWSAVLVMLSSLLPIYIRLLSCWLRLCALCVCFQKVLWHHCQLRNSVSLSNLGFRVISSDLPSDFPFQVLFLVGGVKCTCLLKRWQ